MDADRSVFGSGNIFEDLGIPNADEMLPKADLASSILSRLEREPCTPERAEAASGLSMERLGMIRRGDLDGIRLEELKAALHRLEAAERARTTADAESSRFGFG